MYQLDIKNIYLHEFVEEELYLKPLEGYSKANEGHVCRLTKSLYGLKHAGRQWNKELTSRLQSISFTKWEADHCLFTIGIKRNYVAVVVYVDDLILTGPDDREIRKVQHALYEAFTVKDLGQARYFPGFEIAKSREGIYISQRKYIKDIL